MSESQVLQPDDQFGLPTPSSDLRTVHLRRFPVRVWARSQEHYDGLIREFTLLTLGQDEDEGEGAARHQVPARLLELISLLTEQYAHASSVPDAERDAAAAAGVAVIDLVHHTPVEARAACIALAEMLAEVDDYCRRGEELLTLAAPPETKAFSAWYLNEFIRQLDGEAPTPWPGGLD